ncbi:hypothetical protein BCR44DRAFT_1427354 [Catenaria anguillulae PL171]|uniref:Uncharacterized protein n=1 Tax=Catenaria anguillulae PL171 TaxID=765915 RepID=A0A1Y2HZL2_9FUNG|nr:hypothetical protein BCR44DRAFT_1427354 [Catenaria anguillulae PL171]
MPALAPFAWSQHPPPQTASQPCLQPRPPNHPHAQTAEVARPAGRSTHWIPSIAPVPPTHPARQPIRRETPKVTIPRTRNRQRPTARRTQPLPTPVSTHNYPQTHTSLAYTPEDTRVPRTPESRGPTR